jgi:hypothetical protein
MVRPTTFGVLLYAAAHNRLEDWRACDKQDFGQFPDVALPQYFAPSLETLVKVAVPTPVPPTAA